MQGLLGLGSPGDCKLHCCAAAAVQCGVIPALSYHELVRLCCSAGLWLHRGSCSCRPARCRVSAAAGAKRVRSSSSRRGSSSSSRSQDPVSEIVHTQVPAYGGVLPAEVSGTELLQQQGCKEDDLPTVVMRLSYPAVLVVVPLVTTQLVEPLQQYSTTCGTTCG
jgi:hypothetical protein